MFVFAILVHMLNRIGKSVQKLCSATLMWAPCLIRPGFCGSFVTRFTGFHCSYFFCLGVKNKLLKNIFCACEVFSGKKKDLFVNMYDTTKKSNRPLRNSTGNWGEFQIFSVHPKSIIPGQMINLNMIFHMVVSVY